MVATENTVPPPRGGPRYSAALSAIPTRSAQVILHALLDRHPVADCARFYGVTEAAFLSLLGRALADLAQELGWETAAREAVSPEASEHLRRTLPRAHLPPSGPPSVDDLESLVRMLHQLGPAAIPPPPQPSGEGRWPHLVRIALVAGVIAVVLYLSARG